MECLEIFSDETPLALMKLAYSERKFLSAFEISGSTEGDHEISEKAQRISDE